MEDYSRGSRSPHQKKVRSLPPEVFLEDAKHAKPKLCPKPRKYVESELEKLTNNYDEKNFIGRTQFGKLYRGKINSPVNGVEPRDVTVKIWDEEREKLYVQADCYAMFKDEVMFLRDPTVNYHRNLVKIIGYCDGRIRGVVYDVKPVDTLHNLTTKECFTWPQRIKTVLCFARLLEFLHGQAKQYLLLNISAAHIVLDKDWNPILLDFSTMSGGVLGERGPDKKHIPMAFGYVDPFLASTGLWWESCSDVFAFGVVILGTISKMIVGEEVLGVVDTDDIVLTDEWAKVEYKDGCSLVHKSLAADPYFCDNDGCKITALGMQCIDDDPDRRPTMKEAIERLESLLIVQHHADALGL